MLANSAIAQSFAGKLTGMLLELSYAELTHLYRNPILIAGKVQEATTVLQGSKAAVLQAAQRAKLARLSFSTARAAAISIQRHWQLTTTARPFSEGNQLARAIEASAAEARALAEALQQEEDELQRALHASRVDAAVRRISHALRGWLARAATAHHRYMTTRAMVTIQSAARARAARVQAQQYRRAAVTIQAHARTLTARLATARQRRLRLRRLRHDFAPGFLSGTPIHLSIEMLSPVAPAPYSGAWAVVLGPLSGTGHWLLGLKVRLLLPIGDAADGVWLVMPPVGRRVWLPVATLRILPKPYAASAYEDQDGLDHDLCVDASFTGLLILVSSHLDLLSLSAVLCTCYSAAARLEGILSLQADTSSNGADVLTTDRLDLFDVSNARTRGGYAALSEFLSRFSSIFRPIAAWRGLLATPTPWLREAAGLAVNRQHLRLSQKNQQGLRPRHGLHRYVNVTELQILSLPVVAAWRMNGACCSRLSPFPPLQWEYNHFAILPLKRAAPQASTRAAAIASTSSDTAGGDDAHGDGSSPSDQLEGNRDVADRPRSSGTTTHESGVTSALLAGSLSALSDHLGLRSLSAVLCTCSPTSCCFPPLIKRVRFALYNLPPVRCRLLAYFVASMRNAHAPDLLWRALLSSKRTAALWLREAATVAVFDRFRRLPAGPSVAEARLALCSRLNTSPVALFNAPASAGPDLQRLMLHGGGTPADTSRRNAGDSGTLTAAHGNEQHDLECREQLELHQPPQNPLPPPPPPLEPPPSTGCPKAQTAQQPRAPSITTSSPKAQAAQQLRALLRRVNTLSTTSARSLGADAHRPDHQLLSQLHHLCVMQPAGVKRCRGDDSLRAAGAPPITFYVNGAAAEWRSFTWPLTDLVDVLRLLDCVWIAPTDLVGFEFSGAMRTALERQGRLALSVDLRHSERKGMHAQLDARLVMHLKRWERAYLFPPCFQQLRADEHCLPAKIADGRAYFGCATVALCCCVDAEIIVVEQPDTIFFDVCDIPSTSFRTSQFGDSPDKFVRLVVRGAHLHVPGVATPPVRDPNRSQFNHRTDDERDRARSTWECFHNLTRSLASLTAAPELAGPPLLYAVVIRNMAAAWHAKGWPVPPGYDHPLALALSASDRAYQWRRGPGDGRRVVGVEPDLPLPPPILLGTPQPPAMVVPPITGGGAIGKPSAEETDPPHVPPPTIDLRTAGPTAVILVAVSLLMSPLVYAHSDGFTVIGAELPSRPSRPEGMRIAQAWTDTLVSVKHFAFMIGEYVGGARVYAAPINFRPQHTLVRHRRSTQTTSGFSWHTLAALASTRLADLAARAVVATHAFVKPTALLADFAGQLEEPVVFRFGATSSTSLLRAPVLSAERGPPAGRALLRSQLHDAQLLQAIRQHDTDTDLQDWAAAIQPIDSDGIPPTLLENLPSFTTPELEHLPLSPVYQPLVTPYLQRQPPQPPAPPGAPACIRSPFEMMLPATQTVVFRWLNRSLYDLTGIRDDLRRGVAPGETRRSRPLPIAIGQSELRPFARGRVWDCTKRFSACCVIADFAEPVTTHFNLEYLRARLARYPDQHLVANVLEGVRLDADVELQTVLVPHLTSLPNGFESVHNELGKLRDRGWYLFFPYFPYWPMYVNGQGTVARKLEPDRFRRTTEGGGPRHAISDASGLPAIAINDAARWLHMPPPLHARLAPDDASLAPVPGTSPVR